MNYPNTVLAKDHTKSSDSMGELSFNYCLCCPPLCAFIVISQYIRCPRHFLLGNMFCYSLTFQ